MAVQDNMVSIVIPVFNRAGMIRDAIESVLDVSLSLPVEIIVVDDASTDETWEILGKFGKAIRTVKLKQNGGQSAARNVALDLAMGKFVKFLDSDDILNATHLREEVEALDSSGAEIAVSGWSESWPGRELTTSVAPVFCSIVDDVIHGKAVPTSAALYRRNSTWRWDPLLRKLDDWDYFCQAALGASRIVTLQGSAYTWRQHGGNRATSVSMLLNAKEHHYILRKIEAVLANNGLLTAPRARRMAQYYYKELRVLSLHDRAAFAESVNHIRELDPRFQPFDEERLWYMRVAARLLGFERATLMHSKVKRAILGAAELRG